MTETYDRSEAVFGQFTIDRAAVEMAALFALVLGVTAWFAFNITPEAAAEISPPEQFGSGTTGEATAAGTWAIAEVAFALLVIGGIFAYRRLPEWGQNLVKYNLLGVLGLAAGARYGYPAIPLFVGIVTTYVISERFGLWWLFNNLIAIVLAVVLGVMLGVLFGVVGMAIALVGLTIYDHIFANKKKWMFALGSLAMQLRLPLIVFRPDRWRVEWSTIVETMEEAEAGEEEDESEGAAWGLGTADLMLPAGFVAAVASSPSSAAGPLGVAAVVVLIGAVVLSCARLRFQMLTEGSGAGLPVLSTALLAAYAPLFVLAVVV